MVSVTLSENDITTWMGNSFEIKSAKLKGKEHFSDKNNFFESPTADQQISTRTLEMYANSLKQLFL